MNWEDLSKLVITKVNSVTTLYTEKNTKTRRVNRSCWALVIKFEGETVYNSNGKRYISNINNIIVLPKGCTYEWHCTESGYFSVINFECETTFGGIFSFPIKNSEKILNLFKELEYKRNLKKPMYEMESVRDVYSVILLLLQYSQKKYLPSEKLGKINPAIDYIAKNYNKEITNDELANITGLSTVYFRKLFTEVMGISPIAYVHQLRIKKAKEILKSDYGNITDIAHSLGYLNIYDFSRAFKKYTGIPPSKYEKQLQE